MEHRLPGLPQRSHASPIASSCAVDGRKAKGCNLFDPARWSATRAWRTLTPGVLGRSFTRTGGPVKRSDGWERLGALWRLHREVRDREGSLTSRATLTTGRGFAAICEIEFGLDSLLIERLAVLGDCDSISVTRVNA
jgi:hypothetical protein